MDLTDIVTGLVAFGNNIIIPFLMGIAFLFFIINAIRFFVIGGGNDESREKARSLALYSVFAFVFLLIFWGIVNMLSQSVGIAALERTSRICSDYDTSCSSQQEVSDRRAVDANLDRRNVLDTIAGAERAADQAERDSILSGNEDRRDVLDTITGAERTAEQAETEASLGSNADRRDTLDTIAEAEEGARLAEAIAASQYRRTFLDTVAEAEQAEADRPTLETVNTWAGALMGAVDENYDFRIAAAINSTLAAINDEGASVADRALAATVINNLNRDSGGPQMLDDDTYRAYIDILNTEARQTGQPEVSADTLRTLASRPNPVLEDQITFTQNSLRPHFIAMNQAWNDWGQPEPEAIAAGEAQLRDIYYDTEASDTERLSRLEVYLSDSDASQEEQDSLRSRFVRELNGERFFRGEGPLTEADGQLVQ